jgi:hypothetical protein
MITSVKLLSDTPTSNATGEVASEPAGATATPITVADVQKSEAMKYKSAIEIMLRTIQLKHISNIVPNVKIGTGGSYILQDVQKINLSDIAKGCKFSTFLLPLVAFLVFCFLNKNLRILPTVARLRCLATTPKIFLV